ncbi:MULTISPECIES: phospholipase D family protein [Erwinia]|uniref:phospholipase D n=1 Tax=Erwinia pyrifoliae TaxID=79967 RepID=A0ABY5X6E0_ERWPY|nr:MULTISPECIES: phospholipase D family protein [Erwinia]ADP10183.1 Phospholipase D (PLD) family protein [Erwinia sp. Ejp617]AUX73813.1 phospholipase D family protein [Erwinia pyrifoliae]MCA8875862.1 phospholipase D family protein [Erwinia pyrifoliae]MCT2387659.1 phospholipase D family protein [Erwinia pyrifoliae]MCU8585915.1 phospholipase D family protein [Erwinia pyrifoliae]
MRKSIFFVLAIIMSPPAVATDAPEISVGFSPSAGQAALQIVLSTINGAEQSIDIAAYSFTSHPIAAALIAAQNRGVSVRLVADAKANNDKYTAVTFLTNQDVPVRLNAQYIFMHNKFMVIDSNTVQTGSFNYTSNAAKRNAENVLLVRNAPALAAMYQQEFNRLWSESQGFDSLY